MNKDNVYEYLPLIQALTEGKQLQYKSSLSNGKWNDLDNVYFESPSGNYRIKPEPITFKYRRFIGLFYSKYYVGIYEYSPNTVEPDTFAFNMGKAFIKWID